MFNLETAKEIIIKSNKDKTHNIIVKYDLYDPKGIEVINEVEMTYPRVKINSFDAVVLATSEVYGEVLVDEN